MLVVYPSGILTMPVNLQANRMGPKPHFGAFWGSHLFSIAFLMPNKCIAGIAELEMPGCRRAERY